MTGTPTSPDPTLRSLLRGQLPRLFVAGLLVGWIAAQWVGPFGRIATLEAQQDSLRFRQDRHEAWAAVAYDSVLQTIGRDLELIEAFVTLKCVEDWDDPMKRKLLVAAKLPCPRLLGNNLPRSP